MDAELLVLLPRVSADYSGTPLEDDGNIISRYIIASVISYNEDRIRLTVLFTLLFFMQLPEDDILRELFPEFVDSWLFDIRTVLPQLVREKNATDLRRLGHTLKGSAAQFGAMDLRELGIELMGYADKDEFEKISEVAQRIEKRLLEIKLIIETLL